MAEEEKKLGPGVTYIGNDPDDKAAVTMSGIRFKPGESVDVSQSGLPEKEQQALLKKLEGNRFFKVDGGTDPQEEDKKKAEFQQKQDEAARKEAEEAQQAQYKPPEEPTLEKPASRKKSGAPTFDE